MVAGTFKHYLILLALLAGTSFSLAITVDSSTSDEAGISTMLPDQVGEWVGDQIRFCHNPQHQAIYTVSQLKDIHVCPDCGGPLDSMTLIEKQMLPADTVIVKKRYNHPDKRTILCTIVMSGKERASIHRPERCLVGQGSEIASTHVLEVPLEGRKPMDVRVLDMLRHVRTQGGKPHAFGSYYAYWFVGKDRETSSHYARMFWMAADRVLYNKSHRWAYIAFSGNRDLNDADGHYLDEIKEFTSLAYPQMVLKHE